MHISIPVARVLRLAQTRRGGTTECEKGPTIQSATKGPREGTGEMDSKWEGNGEGKTQGKGNVEKMAKGTGKKTSEGRGKRNIHPYELLCLRYVSKWRYLSHVLKGQVPVNNQPKPVTF